MSAERSLQEELSAETSTRYPLIAAPPSSAGAVQDRSIRACPLGIPDSPVGGSGNVGRAAVVVALAVVEVRLVPTELMAETR